MPRALTFCPLLFLVLVAACEVEDEALGPESATANAKTPAPSTAPSPSTSTSTSTPTPTSTSTPTSTPTSTSTSTPTSPPTPPPALCTTTAVWQNLETCGWPGPRNTGFAAGSVLTKVSGTMTVTTDNMVVENVDVTGGIEVAAKNVIIRNVHVTKSAGGAGGSGVINVHPGASATIEHSTLDGQNATHSCIWHEGTSMTATANECFGVNDGIFSWATVEGGTGAGDNFLIQDNYLHDFTTQAANGHIDGYQTEGASHGVIKHNTIDIVDEQNAGISIWNSRTNADDITIESNLLAGAGFAIYVEDYSPSEASPAGGYSVTNVKVNDNRFSTVHFGCAGYWGVWYPRGNPTDAWNRAGNLVLESGQNVDSQNPTFNGNLCN